MSGIVIRADGLGKMYRIGVRRPHADTLGERLLELSRRPFERLRAGGTGERGEDFWALRDLSFELEHGEVLGVIGANGSGKSTLLRILSRITSPSEGRVELWGRVGSLLEVGTGFHPELTGRENIYLNGAILGMRRSQIDARFDEIVAFAEVERFLETPVKRYSSGMFVRLGFAVAAHLEPEILIIDEVLAVGDVRFQRKCLAHLDALAKRGRTVLFVSHSMPSVKRLCRKALLLEEGRCRSLGPVDEVVRDYLRIHETCNGEAEIPPDAPRIGSGEALIRRVSLRDERGLAIGQLGFGQVFRVVLDLDVLRPIRSAAIEVGISTPEGQRVATVCNLDHERPAFELETGRWRVETTINVTLLPGEYALDAFVQDLDANLTLDWLEHLLSFSALNVAAVGNDHYRWGQVRGFVRPEAHFDVPKRLSEAIR